MKKIISVLLCFAMLSSFVTVSYAADGAENVKYVTVSAGNFTFEVEDDSYPYGYILPPTQVEIQDGDTALSVFARALSDADIESSIEYDENGELIGGYVSRIGGLSDLDGGPMSGWMVTVNDWFASCGADAVYVSDGDTVAYRYSCDWGADLGSLWDSKDTNLKALSFESGTLVPEFDPEVYEYELCLDSDAASVAASYEAYNKNYQVRAYKNAVVSDGAVEGESEYEQELSGLVPPANDLSEILGYCKRNTNIPVDNDDKIIIACGLNGWNSMNETDGGSVYTVKIKISEPAATELETKINDIYTYFLDYTDSKYSSSAFLKDVAPQITEVYEEYTKAGEEVGYTYITKLYEMLGEVIENSVTLSIDAVYPKTSIVVVYSNKMPLTGLSARLKTTVIPKDSDSFLYDEAEDINFTSIDISEKTKKYTISRNDMDRLPLLGERLDFCIELMYNGEALSDNIIKHMTVTERPVSGGGGGSGTISSKDEEISNPVTDTDTDNTPVDAVPSESPYVYFSIPEKTTGRIASFTDMDGYEWAENYINELVADGIVDGISDNEFAPGENITREQFVKLIVTAFDIEIPTQVIPNFTDVDSTAWYAPYVYAASYAGIVGGKSFDTFGVGENITRQDMAAILWRVIGSPSSSYAPYYDDIDDISDYAMTAICVFTDEGTLGGYMELEGTYFRPHNPATRAEAAKIICKAR